MSIALWCVLVAAILPVLTVGFAKRSGKGYDNSDPRGWALNLDGQRKRAHAAHQNSYEFFPFFAVAVIIAEWKGGGGASTDRLAMAIIACRLLYTGCYIADKATLRSVAWILAWFGTIALFVLGGTAR
jgi:uncharacterized MAPEG superfamily protein